MVQEIKTQTRLMQDNNKTYTQCVTYLLIQALAFLSLRVVSPFQQKGLGSEVNALSIQTI